MLPAPSVAVVCVAVVLTSTSKEPERETPGSEIATDPLRAPETPALEIESEPAPLVNWTSGGPRELTLPLGPESVRLAFDAARAIEPLVSVTDRSVVRLWPNTLTLRPRPPTEVTEPVVNTTGIVPVPAGTFSLKPWLKVLRSIWAWPEIETLGTPTSCTVPDASKA